MTGRLKVNYSGWKKIKRRLDTFGDYRSIDVGFFRGSKYGPDNERLNVAQVAAWNDYGSRTNPPRPFLSVDYKNYVVSRGPQIIKQVFMMAMVTNTTQVNTYMKTVANNLSEELKQIIWDYPGSNSPSTIEHKGFNDPLFHTGVMYNSVGYRIKKNTKTIVKR